MARSVARSVVAFAAAVPLALIGTPARADAPGTVTGIGFDACTAPSSAAMTAWLASPYRSIGIYFGGDNRGCAQPNLTPAWVATQQAAGWHLIPLYVGPQASCTTSTKPNRIDNTRAAAQGRATAEDAAAAATALGIAPESVLIYDMEAYGTTDAACRAGVLAFLNAWTARLHDLRYLSGLYSSLASGVADQVAVYGAADTVHPDVLDFARWDQVVTTADPAVPAAFWAPHRRIKQYQGGHDETYGGVTINIDNDYLDVAPLPATPSGDFTGNGWSDVLGRTSAGELFVYPGNGGYLDTAARLRIGTGWQSMSAIVRIGDLTRGGHDDVVTRQASTGELWLYPWNGAAFGTRKRIGTGWNGMRELTAIGDFDRDGYPDLLAAQVSDHNLYLYPGRPGPALGARVRVGTGWDGMSELAGVGDFDGDGYPDLVARATATGLLFLYPGRASGFGTRRQIGAGWGGMRDLIGAGDVDRDGRTDLVAVKASTGEVVLFAGTGSGLRAGVRIATGFSATTPLL